MASEVPERNYNLMLPGCHSEAIENMVLFRGGSLWHGSVVSRHLPSVFGHGVAWSEKGSKEDSGVWWVVLPGSPFLMCLASVVIY